MGADLVQAAGEEGALGVVGGEGERLLVGDGGVLPRPEAAQQVGADGAQVWVGGDCRAQVVYFLPFLRKTTSTSILPLNLREVLRLPLIRYL